MSADIPFDREPPPAAGLCLAVAPRVRRILAPNPGPFTFTGTCTYLVGDASLAVIDPGPDDPAHLEALLRAVGPARVEAILVTHTHRDHSPLAPALARATGAPTYGAGPHRPSRPLHPGETNALDAGIDHDFVPDRRLADGDRVVGKGWALDAVATPGHCANHLAFALEGSPVIRDREAASGLPEDAMDGDAVLFSGDHVMAWSTSIVAPPDGSMTDYMASLARLLGRPERCFLPGHGNPVTAPQRHLRAMIQHRRMREAAILARLGPVPVAIPDLVEQVYAGIAPALKGAAALNTLAHLEDLVARGAATADGPLPLEARYSLGDPSLGGGGANARTRSSSRKSSTRRPLTSKS